jgi:hypothetical protein
MTSVEMPRASDRETEEAGLLPEIAERETFEARFPPEAFEPIALALNVAPTPENVSAIRGWLMPYLEQSFSGNVAKEPSVRDRRKELKRLRDALDLVSRASRRRHGSASLSWTVGDLHNEIPEKFVATLLRLHRRVDEELGELEVTPALRGPKPKSTFRDFAPELVWVYERLTGKKAKKPYWLDDSGVYGGDFYRFAVAVWACVRECIPQLKPALPKSEGALAQELQDHWPGERTLRQGNISRRNTDLLPCV